MCIEVGWQYAETQLSFHHMRLQRRLSQVLQLKKPQKKVLLENPTSLREDKGLVFQEQEIKTLIFCETHPSLDTI